MNKPRLFLLHFAGGNCYSFRTLEALLSEFQVTALELPGRGKRTAEELYTNFERAADDFYQQVLAKLDGSRFYILGHSMGALLALKVTHLLEADNIYPKCIFVSGNPGPGVIKNKKRYLLDKDEFITEIQKLGGLPQEVIDNKEILEYYLPVLRADFEIAENHGIDNHPAVSTPIFAMMGSKEENTEHIQNWNRFTKRQFNHEVMEGDHFFIYKHFYKIADLITNYAHQSQLR